MKKLNERCNSDLSKTRWLLSINHTVLFTKLLKKIVIIKNTKSGAGIVAQQFNLPPVMPLSLRDSDSHPGCSLFTQLPASTPGKAAEDCPSLRTPAPMQETWMKGLASVSPTSAGHRGLYQQMEHLSVFSSLCNSFIRINH